MTVRRRPLPLLLLALLLAQLFLVPAGGDRLATARASAPAYTPVQPTRQAAAARARLDARAASNSTAPGDAATAQQAYGRLPLRFEQNVGQTDARVSYLARGGGYTLYLTGNAAMLALVQRAPQPRHPWDSTPTAITTTATATTPVTAIVSATATAAPPLGQHAHRDNDDRDGHDARDGDRKRDGHRCARVSSQPDRDRSALHTPHQHR